MGSPFSVPHSAFLLGEDGGGEEREREREDASARDFGHKREGGGASDHLPFPVQSTRVGRRRKEEEGAAELQFRVSREKRGFFSCACRKVGCV